MLAFEADCVVVGAGTAGCLIAKLLAEAGLRALVLEARSEEELGAGIEVFHMESSAFERFGLGFPEPPELIHRESESLSWSPDLGVAQRVRQGFCVMNMPAFMARLRGLARGAGAEIVERARVEEAVVEGGALREVRGQVAGEPFSARARLFADASGAACALRSLLPPGLGVETDRLSPEESLYVCLELREDAPSGSPKGSNGYVFHKAFWNRSYGEGFILGIGAPGGYEAAWRALADWKAEYFGDPGRLVARRQGVVPFRRPPYSLVAGGFLAAGDAAFQNKPFSGEGVTSGFAAVEIAAQVAVAALAAGDATREALWPYNARYFRGQGAKFAACLAQLPAAAELSRRDVDFLFRKNLVFSSRDFEELAERFEVPMGPGRALRMAAILAAGAFAGRFSGAALGKLARGAALAGRVKRHYLGYPESPEGFPAWEAGAERLWAEAAMLRGAAPAGAPKGSAR